MLALGSNLGDRRRHLRAAVAGLGDRVRSVSGVYETPPWGDADQPAYLNQVVIVAEPGARPRGWLRLAWELERAAGRVREPERRFGPRTLDVDVIMVRRAYDEADPDNTDAPVLCDEPDLTLPHPRAHLRAFVLAPWAEVEPDAVLPGRGPIVRLLEAEPLASDARAVQLISPSA